LGPGFAFLAVDFFVFGPCFDFGRPRDRFGGLAIQEASESSADWSELVASSLSALSSELDCWAASSAGFDCLRRFAAGGMSDVADRFPLDSLVMIDR
jgi:hypothetical protein